MNNWLPQLYRSQAPNGTDPIALSNATETGAITVGINPNLPPIFSLRHLSHYTGVEYGLLRAIVSRRLRDPYRTFRILKRSQPLQAPSYRTICVPTPGLHQVQSWLNQKVLSHINCHHASVAFAKGDNIVDGARVHCKANWIVKFDIVRFFESISERRVYGVFLDLGYQPIVAFELARICTHVDVRNDSAGSAPLDSHFIRYPTIAAYGTDRLGYLPQGAPTSPMLANLAMQRFDESAYGLALDRDFSYTRYADDLTFSTKRKDFRRENVGEVVGDVYTLLREHSFRPNVLKTDARGPGSRKLVLGLLVDGPQPRLTREFKSKLRQHLYYLAKPSIGPIIHAGKRKFVSLVGLRRHVQGLVSFARQVEPAFGESCQKLLASIEWPV